MTVRKRGKFYEYEFWVNKQRYSGTFNGKKGKSIITDKREARAAEAIELRKVLSGAYHEEHALESLRDFSTFVDKVYCLSLGRITRVMPTICTEQRC